MKLNQELLAEEQLNDNRIQQHHKRILGVLKNKKGTFIPIVEACTIENQGILSHQELEKILLKWSIRQTIKPNWIGDHVITCIPAAGAGSRYFSDVYQQISCGQEVDPELLDFFQKHGHQPKALIQATTEGDSFLDLKIIEQMHLFPCHGTVLIVGSGLKDLFLEKLKKQPWLVLEQGKPLCTIRFQMDGSPFIDEDGKYAPVSAGHGELIHLFSHMADYFPQATCLHIRNVDNIIGTDHQRQKELQSLAHAFAKLKQGLDWLRVNLKQENRREFEKAHSPESLFQMFAPVFYWQPMEPGWSTVQKWEHLQTQSHRPLSLFGVVQKQEKDTGGGPVFAQMSSGEQIKLCMEMPHAMPEQMQEYFGKNGKSTHFNPVLTFFELRDEENQKFEYEKLFDDQFWLMSKKEYKGKPVCYHETILYELIGNSKSTNLIFLEVSRDLFHPHKSIYDSWDHDRKYYGFEAETPAEIKS